MILPISLLEHPQLNDCDIHVLLVLDLLGWREGEMDGVVRASNKEIGERARKKITAVRESIRRLASLNPSVISLDKSTPNSRESIRLTYDRFGGANGFPPRSGRIPAHSSVQGGRDPAYPQGGFPPTPHIETREIDLVVPVVGVVGGFPPTPHLTLAELIAWLPSLSDDQDVLKQLRRLCPLWFDWLTRRCPRHAASASEWIQDALLSASEADDVAIYARKILKLWVGAGGRPEVELAPKPKAVPDETDTPAPMNGVPRPSKPSYAQRVQADRERLMASFDNLTDTETDG